MHFVRTNDDSKQKIMKLSPNVLNKTNVNANILLLSFKSCLTENIIIHIP